LALVPLSQRVVRPRSKILSTYFPGDRFLLYIEGQISRGSTESPRLERWAVECSHCHVPLDSPNVPKSTSRRFRHFKQLLRSLFEVKKKKDSLKGSNKCVLYGFYTNNVLVRHDAKTNASRVVKEFEVDRMEPNTKIGSRTSL
jgi:hypothetical protein